MRWRGDGIRGGRAAQRAGVVTPGRGASGPVRKTRLPRVRGAVFAGRVPVSYSWRWMWSQVASPSDNGAFMPTRPAYFSWSGTRDTRVEYRISPCSRDRAPVTPFSRSVTAREKTCGRSTYNACPFVDGRGSISRFRENAGQDRENGTFGLSVTAFTPCSSMRVKSNDPHVSWATNRPTVTPRHRDHPGHTRQPSTSRKNTGKAGSPALGPRSPPLGMTPSRGTRTPLPPAVDPPEKPPAAFA